MSSLRRLRVDFALAHAMLGNDPLLVEAFDLAEHSHRRQSRNTAHGRTPYLLHPLLVAARVRSWGVTERETIAAALLHDVFEDAPERAANWLREQGAQGETVWELTVDAFGPDVMTTVRGLTVPGQAEYLAHVTGEIADPRVLIVKLADFYSNALALTPVTPGYERLKGKYRPLLPVLRSALQTTPAVRALMPEWERVVHELQETTALD